MTLVFRAKNTVFTNYITDLNPVSSALIGNFVFGESKDKSLINKATGGTLATLLGSTKGNEYKSNSVVISNYPLTDESFRFRPTTMSLSHSVSGDVINGHNEAIVSGNMSTNYGLRNSGTDIILVLPTVITEGYYDAVVSVPFIGYPYAYSYSVSSVGSQMAVTLAIKHNGLVKKVTKSFPFGLRDAYTEFLDIGRYGVGDGAFIETSAFLAYGRALSDSEISSTLNYLSR